MDSQTSLHLLTAPSTKLPSSHCMRCTCRTEVAKNICSQAPLTQLDCINVLHQSVKKIKRQAWMQLDHHTWCNNSGCQSKKKTQTKCQMPFIYSPIKFALMNFTHLQLRIVHVTCINITLLQSRYWTLIISFYDECICELWIKVAWPQLPRKPSNKQQ